MIAHSIYLRVTQSFLNIGQRNIFILNHENGQTGSGGNVSDLYPGGVSFEY
jgi:hypothetical protein